MLFYGKTFAEKQREQAGKDAYWKERRLRKRIAELEEQVAMLQSRLAP